MSDSENSEDNHEIREKDTIKILLATDCHLGYEHSTKRLQENDSFITFEEILNHSLKHEVDFILLGGDLFHDCKPNQRVMTKCVELLKKYVMGSRDINIQFLSDPELVLPHTSERRVNYEDPNLNIAMPIFSLHGNHDNPSFESVGVMDLLGASGLMNYFGKWSDLNGITIAPLVFKKGRTHLALYGIGHMNDQRLSRLFKDEKVEFLKPEGIPQPFNMFVLHQNRAKHTVNGYIPEDNLPGFLDLVFWGHEHQCRIKPEPVINESVDPPAQYFITQPGSSVATSLCEGESVKKHIGLLMIHETSFHIKKIKLETIRPFVFKNLHLSKVDIKLDLTQPESEFVCAYVDEFIETYLLPKAELQLTGHPNQPTVPLIRLKVHYVKDSQMFDTMRLSRKYYNRVANPLDMILLRKDKKGDKKNKSKDDDDDDDDDDRDDRGFDECFGNNDDDEGRESVQGFIKNYFEYGNRKEKMNVLSVNGLNEALARYIDTGDDDAFQDVVSHQMKKNQEYMKNRDVDGDDDIVTQLKSYRDQRLAANAEEEQRDIRKLLDNDTRRARIREARETQAQTTELFSDDENNENDESRDDEQPKPARGRGRGRRATSSTRARGARGGARGRAAKSALNVNVTPKSSMKNMLFNTTSGSSKGSKGNSYLVKTDTDTDSD